MTDPSTAHDAGTEIRRDRSGKLVEDGQGDSGGPDEPDDPGEPSRPGGATGRAQDAPVASRPHHPSSGLRPSGATPIIGVPGDDDDDADDDLDDDEDADDLDAGGGSGGPRRSVARRRGLGRGLGAILSLPPDVAGYGPPGEDALIDPLTDLPNRTLLDERLDQALVMCRQDDASLAVLVISLDGFSNVNELFGHRVGDALLHDVAERMSSTRRKSDTVARFAGDEFVVVCPYVGTVDAACRMAARILEDVSRPTSVDGVEHRLSASIGVVVVEPGSGQHDVTAAGPGAEGDTEDTVESLLGDAALAMRRAKDEGGGAWTLFDATMREDAAARHQHRQGLRTAMEDGGLFLEYEPVVLLDTGEEVGESALLAWRLPESVVEGPEALLELVDEAGLAVPVGRWVLDEALSDLSTRRAGAALPESYRVWVKLSASFVTDPALVESIDELTAKHRIPPSMLGIDIVEPVPATLAAAETTLQALVVREVALAIDDFGARPTNLTLLQRLPIGSLKLAPDVVAALDQDDGQEGAALVRGLVSLGRALGLTVIAQGVTSEAQVTVLRALGCGLGQGPHLGGGPVVEPLWASAPTPTRAHVPMSAAPDPGPGPDPAPDPGTTSWASTPPPDTTPPPASPPTAAP
ncbi:MAG: EAL domain-containing protein [Acidimicrobiales bacterium]